MSRNVTSRISQVIRELKHDRKITADGWQQKLKPLLDQLPAKASEDTRELALLWSDDKIQMDGNVRAEMSRVLSSFGYGMPDAPVGGKGRAGQLRGMIGSNVSETDDQLTFLLGKTGRADATVGIAVLDNGVDLFHPAIGYKGHVNAGEIPSNGIDDDKDGKVDNSHGWDYVDQDNALGVSDWHGTISSSIAGKGSDQIRLHPARVLGGGSPYDIHKVAQAIDDAVKQGAKVINMSFGFGEPGRVPVMREVLARHPDVLFVVAAGNDRRSLNEIDPELELAANVYPNLAVVVSASLIGTPAGNTNFGPPATHAATGDAVTGARPGAGYQGGFTGTSFAAPAVSNLAARLLLLDPKLSPTDVKRMMAETSEKRWEWSGKVGSGGVIDTRKASTLAAITGLMRQGLTAEAAAGKLMLSKAERAELLPMAPSYLVAPLPF